MGRLRCPRRRATLTILSKKAACKSQSLYKWHTPTHTDKQNVGIVPCAQTLSLRKVIMCDSIASFAGVREIR